MTRWASDLAHRRRSIVACAIGLLLLAAPVEAARLAYDASSKLKFSNLGRAEVTATGTGVATVNGSAGVGHLTTLRVPLGTDALSTVLPITDPIVTAGGIVAVFITSVRARPDLQGGTFRPISGAIQSTTALTLNTMPSTGAVRICLFNPDCSASLDLDVGATVNGVFVGAGVGGVLTVGGPGNIRISLLGAPWTVKTASVSNRTDNGDITTFARNGWAHGPASGTSSTAIGGGVVQLVTATQTFTVGIPGNQDKSGNINTFRIRFLPEPGLMLLLAAGAAGLAVLGGKRTRR